MRARQPRCHDPRCDSTGSLPARSAVSFAVPRRDNAARACFRCLTRTLPRWWNFCGSVPVTALWIWPRYGTPDLIVHLICAMYAAIAVGVACLRLFKQLNRDALVALRVRRDAATQELSAVEEQTSADAPEAPHLRHVWLKWVHGGLLLFAWIMLEGAGEAFSANARVSGFPYEQDDVSDSLHARCYGRDLRVPDAPQWLTKLACGDGPVCAQSVTGGRNTYHQD
jgi:hypothetical protein